MDDARSGEDGMDADSRVPGLVHTPGPWRWIVEDYSMASLEGPNESIDHVLSISPCRNCLEHAKKKGDPQWTWGRCRTPSEDDARLIAVAPDLFTVLKLIVAQIEDYERANNLAPNPGRQDCWDSVTQAKLVIAKAEGRL